MKLSASLSHRPIGDRKRALRAGVPQVQHHFSLSTKRPAAEGVPLSKRTRGRHRNLRLPFVPPEDWHEPRGAAGSYRIVAQSPGRGFRHVLTPAEIRARLAQLPAQFVEGLEVVQLSRMTRKKQSFPCYGLQWGSSIYLYPIEQDLVECYSLPPKPSQLNEARMYGGRWVQLAPDRWNLVWTEAAIRDFYLHNILIHELGHLLDNRNSRYADRERFAEWFAMRYGYPASQGRRQRRAEPVRRRHHMPSS